MRAAKILLSTVSASISSSPDSFNKTLTSSEITGPFVMTSSPITSSSRSTKSRNLPPTGYGTYNYDRPNMALSDIASKQELTLAA
jgi:hypothetical protein